MKNYSIAFYDSGVGGLSVLSECKKLLPSENFIYLGDNENLPYGNKSVSTLFSIAKKNICILESYGVKAIVLACNTLSTSLYSELSSFTKVKIIPTFPVYIESILPNSLLICTNRTAKSKYLKPFNNLVDILPLCHLASDIENNVFNLEKINLNSHFLHPLKNYNNVILGCTHYSLIKSKIQKHFDMVNIIDPATIVADNLIKHLTTYNLTAKGESKITFIGSSANFNQKVYLKYYNI